MPGGNINSYPKTVKTYATGYRELIEKNYNATAKMDYRQGVFNMDTTEQMEDRDVELNGITDVEEWAEDQAAQVDVITEGFEVKYKQVRYGKRIKFGSLMRDFVMWKPKMVSKASSELGRKIAKLEQVRPFSLFKDGFDSTVLTGYGDLKPTFSTQHPLSPDNSTTWSNALSNGATLSETSIIAAMTLLDETPDENGDLMNLGENGYIILVSNWTDFLAAQRIVSETATERPGTSNRDINVIAGTVTGAGKRNIEVRYVKWLRNPLLPNAWYMVAKGESNLNILYSQKFYTDDYKDNDTDTLYVRGRVMFAYGLGSPRGVVGSKGDGQAYSG
jgi:hypothetical protein